MYGFARYNARYNKVNLEHGGKTAADLCKTGVAGPGGVAAAGVAPLSVDANLSAIADQRTADMIVAGYISHEGYQTSEIVAQNYPSAQDVVYGWATSPDHYAAMTNPNFTICGIGCSFEESGGAYWCVTFQ